MKQNQPQWQVNEPFDAIIFDCDSTLSAIEGIDELAKHANVEPQVAALTELAMSKTGVTLDLYERRINLVKPTRHQLIELGKTYFEKRTEDCVPMIETFLALKKPVYIISAGLNPSVKIFGELLGIHEPFIYAVDVYFDENGQYRDFDRNAPTAHHQGKRKIINEIMQTHRRVFFSGDGMNDFEANDIVDRFVGFGGVNIREKFINLCDFYVKSPSLSTMLPLALTAEEIQRIPPALLKTVHKGMTQIQVGGVNINPLLT